VLPYQQYVSREDNRSMTDEQIIRTTLKFFLQTQQRFGFFILKNPCLARAQVNEKCSYKRLIILKLLIPLNSPVSLVGFAR